MPIYTPGKVVLRNQLPADTDADAYIAAVEAADGQALEPGVKFAIKNFVLCCKQDGIWTAIKASCILAGARTLSGALVPLVGTAPTNVGPFVSGDYNRKTGLVGDGSTKYLNSNRNNNADPQNSKHLAIYVSSMGNAADQYLIAAGGFVDSGNSSISRTPSFYQGRVNVAVDVSAIMNSGVLPSPAFVGVVRTSANAQSIRASGTVVSSGSASRTPSNQVINIYAGPAGQRFFSNSRLAFYSIGEALDLALLDARVTDLINAIGAAIP